MLYLLLCIRHFAYYIFLMYMQGYSRAKFFISTIHNLKQKVRLSYDKYTYILSGCVTLNFFYTYVCKFVCMYCKLQFHVLRILNFSYFCFQTAPNAVEGGDGGDICWNRADSGRCQSRELLGEWERAPYSAAALAALVHAADALRPLEAAAMALHSWTKRQKPAKDYI